MRIRVKLYGEMKQFAPGKESQFDLTLLPGVPLADALEILGIPRDSPHTVLVNGRRVKKSTGLKENDILVIFPQLCGG